MKLSDTFANDDSPVNCSSISKNDFVTCYRIIAFDPDRSFVSAGAAYFFFIKFWPSPLVAYHDLGCTEIRNAYFKMF